MKRASVRLAVASSVVWSLYLYAAGPYKANPGETITVPAGDVITAAGVPAMWAAGGTITAPGPVTASVTNFAALLADPGGSLAVTNGTVTSTGAGEGRGAHARGGTLTVTGGSITADSVALLADQAGSSLTATGVAVETTQPSTAVAWAAFPSTTMTIHGGSVRSAAAGTWGVRVDDGAHTIVDSGTSITTEGDTGIGAYTAGSELTLNGISVLTRGFNAHGINANRLTGHIGADNVTVITDGNLSDGVFAYQQSTIDLTNSTVITNGSVSRGLQADNDLGLDPASVINATNTTVTVNGPSDPSIGGAYAALAQFGATVNLTGGTMRATNPTGTAAISFFNGPGGSSLVNANGTTFDSANRGVRSADGGHFIATNSTIIARTHGVLVTSTSDALVNNVMQITGGSITAGQDAFRSEGNLGGTIDVTGAVVTNGPLVLNAVDSVSRGPGEVTLNATNVALKGDVFAAPANVANLHLVNSSLMGKATNGGAFAVDAASRWDMTGSSDVASLDNQQLVAFSPTAPFSTLIVHSSLSNAATIGLNTQLGGDGSPSDVLVIEAGPISSGGTIRITNRGGIGALTTGDGILVVRSTIPSTFALAGGFITAGGWTYTLRRGGNTPNPATDNNWYLVSQATRSTSQCDIDGDGQPEFVTGAGPGGGPHVRVWRLVGGAVQELGGLGFFAYADPPGMVAGVSVACGDVDGDGIAEIVTGAGGQPGGGPHVRVWSGLGGAITERLGLSFYAYDPTFGGGVTVAVGDVTGDGISEIITGAGPGGDAQVRVWSAIGGTFAELPGLGFFAYDLGIQAGVNVAAGDVDGDGIAEIITGAGAQPGGGPHVRVWSTVGGAIAELFGGGFYAYDPAFSGGVTVAAGDVDGDGIAELITGAGPGGGPHVRVWSTAGGTIAQIDGNSFYAYDASFTGGVFVAAGDLNGDGRADLLTGPGEGSLPEVRIWELSGSTISGLVSFEAYDPAFGGGVRVAR